MRQTLSQKYPTRKRDGGVVQVVEHQPSKHEAMSSNPNITPPKKSFSPKVKNNS
jgi:hypothetical protein